MKRPKETRDRGGVVALVSTVHDIGFMFRSVSLV